MAHKQQQDFFESLAVRFSECIEKASRVLEVGSQNINGSIRQYFPNATEYLGIDIGMAADVDWVIPGELIELPNGWAEVTISTECFEHCEAWQKVFVNMIRIAAPRSLVIITCAAPGRHTHGTTDSDEYSSPFTTHYYKNLGVDDISEKIKVGLYFSSHGFEVNSISHDLYFWGVRSDSDIHSLDHYWEEPMSRLARAQGQLGQAAARHASIQAELTRIRNEAESAKAEAESAKAEAESAKAEKKQLAENLRSIQEAKTWRIAAILRAPLNSANKFLRS